MNGRVQDHIVEYRRQLAKTETWFGRMDSLSRIQSIDYYLNDPFYRNHMFIYGKMVSFSASATSHIRALALGLLGKIKQIREDMDATEMSELFEELGCTPFSAFECNGSINNSESDLSFSLRYLIYNMREKTISFLLNDPKAQLNSQQLEPG